MPENEAPAIPSMRIEIEGEDVSRRWGVSSLRAVISEETPHWSVSIDIPGSDNFSVPKLGTPLTVSLGYASEYPWSKTFELDAVTLSGLPNVFTLAATEVARSQPRGHIRRGGASYEARLGENIETFNVSHSSKQGRDHWEGTFDTPGAPRLSVGDDVTLIGFHSFLDEELEVSAIAHRFDVTGFQTRFTVKGAG